MLENIKQSHLYRKYCIETAQVAAQESMARILTTLYAFDIQTQHLLKENNNNELVSLYSIINECIDKCKKLDESVKEVFPIVKTIFEKVTSLLTSDIVRKTIKEPLLETIASCRDKRFWGTLHKFIKNPSDTPKHKLTVALSSLITHILIEGKGSKESELTAMLVQHILLEAMDDTDADTISSNLKTLF